MYVVGIDISKRSHEACVISDKGDVIVKPFKFSNTHTGFNHLLSKLPKDEIVFGMEATGHYWLPLYMHLLEKKFTVHVINPIQSDALRNMYIRKTKNDAVDSFIIAEVIRFGRFSETNLSNNDLISMRELCRQRFYFVDMIGDLKRKTITLLDQIFPEYDTLFSDIFGTTSLELLKNYTTPDEISDIPTEKLIEILETASRKRLSVEKAHEIKEAAKNSFGITLFNKTHSLLIKQLLEQIESLEKSVKDIEKEIHSTFSKFDNHLTSIIGIGPTLAAVIFSEIGDIKRFDSPAKLAAFAGIDPSVNQSGEFTGTRSKMSKRGSPYLRRALWMASTIAAIYDPAIKAIYEKKKSQGKHHMVIIGHICRKMVNIIYAVLRDNKPYVPAV